MLLILLVLFFGTGLNAHPLHISIINVSIEGKVMTLRISTYVDDWETAYFHFHSKPIDLTKEENYKGNWFVSRLNESFQIRENEKSDPVLLSTEKVTFDELTMTIEMRGKLIKAPNSLYIYNALLTDIYPDQTNLVIFGFKNKETGIKFDVKKHDAEVMLK